MRLRRTRHRFSAGLPTLQDTSAYVADGMLVMKWPDNQSLAFEAGGQTVRIRFLHARLEAEGHDLSLRAVRQWKRRNAISAQWLLVLLNLRETELPEGWAMEDIF